MLYYCLIVIILLNGLFGVHTFVIKKCVDDEDCGLDEYCTYSLCLRCINCANVNRQNLTHCSKSLNDCGDCLYGADEIKLTDGPITHLKPCLAKASDDDNSCINDLQCSDGEFCFKRKCNHCLDCKSLNMHRTETCAKSIQNCGSCLPGYLDLISKVDHSRSCAGPTASLLSQNTEVQVNVHSGSTVGVLLLLGVSVTAVTAIFVYRYRKHFSGNTTLSDSPPPYPETVCNNLNSDEIVEESIVCTSYKELEEVDNNARVLCLPKYAFSTPSRSNSSNIAQDGENISVTWRPCNENCPGNARPVSFTETTENVRTTSVDHTDQPAPKRQKQSD